MFILLKIECPIIDKNRSAFHAFNSIYIEPIDVNLDVTFAKK